MSRVETLAEELVEAFTFILNERMAGIPILNKKLQVEAVEFQDYEGRPFGVIITPWLMNLVMFPAEGENWSGMNTGETAYYEFPAGERVFQINEFEGVGQIQTHSLYSPMSRFVNQDHARAAARKCLVDLMTDLDPEEHLDERRLKQFIEDGKMPSEPDSPDKDRAPVDEDGAQASKPVPEIAKRDFLRGNFGGKS